MNQKIKTSVLPSAVIIASVLVLSACNTLSPPASGIAGSLPASQQTDGQQNDSQSATRNVSGSTTQNSEQSLAKDSSGDDQTPSSAEESASAEPPKAINLSSDSLFNLLAAEFAGNAGDVEGSLKYYQQASGEIEDSRIAARSAYIAIYGEDYEAALEALKRWQELEPDAADLPRVYAITYLKLGQPENAVPYIETILDKSHEGPAGEAMAVKQLLAKEATTEDAYVVLQQLNARPEKNEHMLVLESRYAAQLKKYDESLDLLDQVLVIDPSLHEVLIIKSRVLVAQGKPDEATAIIRQVVDELPNNDVLRSQYARMLVEQRQLEEAIEQYAVLQEHNPDDAEVTLSLGLLYIETKQLDLAVEELERLIELDKNVAEANYYLGRVAQNQGDDKRAVSYYVRVKAGNYYFDSQLRIGVLLALLGKPEESLNKLQALAEDQTRWELRVKAYHAQGEVLRSLQRYKEGLEMYSRALQQNKDDTSLLYARGLMAEKVDRLDMAEADLLKVISKEPENANALNALGYTLADRTARYQEALEYIQRAAELVPDDPAILDSLGWVSFRLGKMEDAIKWLSQAFDKLVDAEIAAHYGEVLWQTNQKEKARQVWQQGKRQNADNPVLIETLKRIKP